VKRLEWYIARRYLASRRKGRFLSLITLIAIGGIFLGVAALITVIAVMTGLQRDLQSKIIGSNPHIYVFQSGTQGYRLGNWKAVIDSIGEVPNVVAMQPFIMTKVGLLANGIANAATLFGIDANTTQPAITEVERKLKSGELKLGPTRSGNPGLILGDRLAAQVSATYGDEVQVVAFENIKTGGGGELYPIVVKFEITGIVHTGMFEYDSQNMYADLAPVQELLSLPPDMVSGIAINVSDPWRADEARPVIAGRLGYGYWTDDWKTMNQGLFSALKLEKIAMAVILFLIVLVAAFNIISTLIMVVADKTREIGILKSMGMTDGGILRVFVLQGLTIGVVGTALGTALGLTLVGLLHKYEFIKLDGTIYFIDRLPVALDVRDVLTILLTSMAIAFVATIYPARQASKLLPVEAIHHD
jgi:lipoprotein-releasing system permease protein